MNRLLLYRKNIEKNHEKNCHGIHLPSIPESELIAFTKAPNWSTHACNNLFPFFGIDLF